MNRRMILLAAAVTTLAMTCSAKAYTMERVPDTESIFMLEGDGTFHLHAHFGGLFWPYIWHEADWYWDGQLVAADTGLSGQTAESTGEFPRSSPGTYEAKVRAKYDTVPFGIHAWTSYLTWTVTIVDRDTYTIERVEPLAASLSLAQGTGRGFTARFGGIVWFADWYQARWYVDGKLESAEALFGQTDESSFDPTFSTTGTHEVKVHACYKVGDDAVWTGFLTWTVEVVAHPPCASRVSPESPVTVYAGAPLTFTVEGTDPADDLRLCEVSLDGVFQTIAFFSGAASGSTASWTRTFNTPGKYRVVFVPLDLAGNYGTAEVWTVEVEPNPQAAGLTGMVIELDAQGQAKGPSAGAKVDLTGPAAGTATTDVEGKFAFTGLNPGTYTVNVSETGYYAQSRSVSLTAGETKYEVFQLTPESLGPSAFDFTSPDGKHFIEGLPGDLSFSARVAWNGSPGSVRFNVGGISHPATVTDLGEGEALASLTIPAPATIPECSELQVIVENGEGTRVTVGTGVYLHPTPELIQKWVMGRLIWEDDPRPGMGLRVPYYFKFEGSLTFWDIASAVSTKGAAGIQEQLIFDPWAGTFKDTFGGFGRVNLTIATGAPVDVLGEARIDLSGTRDIGLTKCDPATVMSSWKASFSGKAGIQAPVVNVIGVVFPPAAPAITALQKVPIAGDLVKALKFRLYLILGVGLSGKYEPPKLPDCWLGTTSVSLSGTFGLEGQVVYALRKWGCKIEAGVYAGVTGTPEFQACPTWEFEAVTLRGYTGVFASAWSFRFSREVGVMLRLPPEKRQAVLAIASILGSDLEGGWEPIGDRCLRWGETNLLVGERSPGRLLYRSSGQGETSQETRLVENVIPLASPAILCGSSERLILFCLHDPNKPWHAATDIGTVRQADDQPWVLDRIADDQAAEFSPSIVAADSGVSLAAWERVSGDVSDANEPGQIAPHLEIVAAWFDPSTGLWSTPEQLTSNAVTDHQPVPIALGTMRGILWIQNEGGAAIGDANSGDRLMFAKWSGNGWVEPQTLWSAQTGILDFAFVADGLSEGHVVLAADGDGDPNTTADCELYLLSTTNGAWQTATQLTSDSIEDAMPALVAPNGVPMCVWNADGTLVYSQLHDWNPRQVYSEHTLANEAPSLDGVTMPGGAAIAYTVQGPSGVDIVASFYDADLDCWSLPRQLTGDEHAETALSLTCDANELVIAYLKTQTLRDDMDVEIDGQIHHLENLPQPGRTDLYVMRHTLADDLAVVSESMVLEPANPAPGTVATIHATIESRGDLPLQDVVAVFYDGDPSNGGVTVGDRQVISGTLIAGGKQNVSVSWNVPLNESSHEIFAVVDPCLAVEDRDRSNNLLSVYTVLPDLAIETCWSTEVSSTTMALTARVVNTGVIPVDAFDLSWRLGAPDGEQIGRSTIGSLIAGGAYEATFVWDTDGHLNPGEHAQVFAVADSAGTVVESDETNNVHSLAVFSPPACPQADLNADCRADLSDFALFASRWFESGCADPDWCGGADYGRNGEVDLCDLAILAEHWLE